MRTRCRSHAALLVLFSFALGSATHASPPDVPQSIIYQGVLLDDLGAPRTGTIDLIVRIYDAGIGGTVLYRQDFLATALTDGVFSVLLGPSGSATDTPVNPLTTSLAEVFDGTLQAVSPTRHLELTVGVEGPLARTQLHASPFALRADSAAVADTATTAVTVQTFGGLPEAVFSQIYDNTNLDGTGPGNADPLEGQGDVDGDGIANFVDPDNDGDGIDDGTEIAQGSDINVVTPNITALVPSTFPELAATTVTVQGSNFDPGQTVVFGSEAPAPQNLTPTSFDVPLAGTQEDGTVPVIVTLPNGEVANSTFTFTRVIPSITGFVPATSPELTAATVTVQGTNFEPGQTVTFGSEAPAPQNLTPTSFDVSLSGVQEDGTVPVVVTLPHGESDTANFTFTPITPDITGIAPNNWFAGFPVDIQVTGTGFRPDLSPTLSFGTETPVPTLFTDDTIEFTSAGQPVSTISFTITLPNGASDSATFEFGDVSGSTFIEGQQAHLSLDNAGVVLAIGGRDEYGSHLPPSEFAFPSYVDSGLAGQLAIGFDGADRLIGIRCRQIGAGCDVELSRDTDADLALDTLVTTIESQSTSQDGIFSPAIHVDGAGRLAVGFKVRAGVDEFRLLHDRNGDESFGGANETTVLADAALSIEEADIALDSADRIAATFRAGSGNFLHLVYDRNGDGDFDDTVGGAPETTTLTPVAGGFCASMAFGPGDVLSIVRGSTLYRDFNGDGDFVDAGEATTLSAANNRCHVARNNAGGLAVAIVEASGVRVFDDRNADDDFTDPDEEQFISDADAGRVAVSQLPAGLAVVVGSIFGGNVEVTTYIY